MEEDGRVTLVGRAGHALHHGCPVRQLFVVYGAEVQQRIVRVRLVGLELDEQALGGRLDTT